MSDDLLGVSLSVVLMLFSDLSLLWYMNLTSDLLLKIKVYSKAHSQVKSSFIVNSAIHIYCI